MRLNWRVKKVLAKALTFLRPQLQSSRDHQKLLDECVMDAC